MIKHLNHLPKDKKQKVILVGVVTLMAVACVGNFYVLAQVKAIRSSNRRIEDLHAKIADARAKARQEASHATQRAEYEAFLQTQQERLVEGDAFRWVVREISLLSESQPAQVLSVRPGSVGQHGRQTSFETFSARIELAGSYDEIGYFINAIESTFPMAEVRSVALSGGNPKAPALQVALEISFLIKKDPVALKPNTKTKST